MQPTLVHLAFSHKFFSSLLVDVLVSSSAYLRREARQCFGSFIRVQPPVVGNEDEKQLPSFCFLLKILLSTRLPFWNLGGRGASRRKGTLAPQQNCLEYFALLSDVLLELCQHPEYIEVLPEFDLAELIENELQWFFELKPVPETDLVTDGLLAGHAVLMRTLLCFRQVNKVQLTESISAESFIKLLIEQFLFPESKLLSDAAKSSDIDVQGNTMRQANLRDSRNALFMVLLELAHDCPSNLALMCQALTQLHLTAKETGGKWEYSPPVNERQAYGFVGLRNAGATCYMNSVIQQLFVHAEVRAAVLALDDDQTEPAPVADGAVVPADANATNSRDGMFYNFQSIFGHLLDSRRQFFVPEAGCFMLLLSSDFRRAFGSHSDSGDSLSMFGSSKTPWSSLTTLYVSFVAAFSDSIDDRLINSTNTLRHTRRRRPSRLRLAVSWQTRRAAIRASTAMRAKRHSCPWL
jgi:ubiquitin carboxyl-terminal hydrolase 9/24